jgi:hypothetical protein
MPLRGRVAVVAAEVVGADSGGAEEVREPVVTHNGKPVARNLLEACWALPSVGKHRLALYYGLLGFHLLVHGWGLALLRKNGPRLRDILPRDRRQEAVRGR